uniref:PKD2L-2 n=1 Tax=Schmidtea mediterranea TaxID=79327 RepID=A0A0H3YFR3_SCHMD|nr:PKD2L-2 [Schmidtea mediterranea]
MIFVYFWKITKMLNKSSVIKKNLNIVDSHDNAPCAMDGEYFDNGKITIIDYQEIGFKNENCWNKFKIGIRSLWATKHTENCDEDKNLYANTTVRELVVYMLFLVLLFIITFSMRPGYMFYFTNFLNNLFLTTQFNDNSGTFSSLQAQSDFWKFLMGPLLNGLYWNVWYNSRNMPANEQNYIYFENKLLGVPRIRQIRVKNNSCIIPNILQNKVNQCYAAYSRNIELKESFGFQNSSAWNYTEDSILQSGSFQGQITTYGGGGFYVDLATSQENSLNIILSLFNNRWLDRNTRAVLVDFTIYNANINLFCIIKLVGEFPPVGGVLPSYEFRTVKLIRYVNPLDFFVLACEILFVLYLLYYIIEELIEIDKHKSAYFCSLWNVLDVIVLSLGVICVSFHIYRMYMIQTMLSKLLENGNIHPNFEYLSFWQLQYDNLSAFLLFLAITKIFKYISFNKMMTQLISTLNYCLKDLVGFSLMFFIVFLAFAQAGYLIFGSQLANYREFYICIFTLFRIILNDCNFKELLPLNPILGPLYFILYVFFVFFILFNMFLAILDDAYGDIKEELEEKENEFEITDFLKEKSRKVFEKLHLKREKIVDLENAMKTVDTNNDGVMDFDEWKTELKRRGYAETEIESLFAKFDTDGDRVLDEQEQLKMLKELNDQKTALETELIEERDNQEKLIESDAIQPISYGKYMGLSRHIDDLENIIEILTQKFDIILDNFQNIIKTKEKSRESTEIILNAFSMMVENSEDYRKEKIEAIIQDELYKLNRETYSCTPFQRISQY